MPITPELISYSDLENRFDGPIPAQLLRSPQATGARRVADLLIQATKADNKAAEWEASADRWAAKGNAVTAARNLASAKDERAWAESLRKQARELEGATASFQIAAE